LTSHVASRDDHVNFLVFSPKGQSSGNPPPIVRLMAPMGAHSSPANKHRKYSSYGL
jgi:hypothetical protein